MRKKTATQRESPHHSDGKCGEDADEEDRLGRANLRKPVKRHGIFQQTQRLKLLGGFIVDDSSEEEVLLQKEIRKRKRRESDDGNHPSDAGDDAPVEELKNKANKKGDFGQSQQKRNILDIVSLKVCLQI